MNQFHANARRAVCSFHSKAPFAQNNLIIPLLRVIGYLLLSKFVPTRSGRMENFMKARGSAFRLTGFILGVVGTFVSITAIVFSLIGVITAKHG